MSPKLSPPNIGEVLARQAEDIDTRYHPSAALRRQLNKVFLTHWSFLLGEIALYSFVVLLITGVYLTLFSIRPWSTSPTTVSINRCGASRCRVPTSPRWTFPSRCAVACSCARSITGPL